MLVEGSMAVEKRLEEEMATLSRENSELKKQIEEINELLIKNSKRCGIRSSENK